MNNVTVVTGIFDLGRGQLDTDFKRPFEFYIENFKKLLQIDNNMIIYIEKEYEDLVWTIRDRKNTLIITKDVDEFKTKFEFYDKVQEIRNNSNWYNQSGWLKGSAQGSLELYNPLVLSKMFLLNDARILDPFHSTHMIWLDGGITNTVHEGYFTKDKILDKLPNYFNKFSFICFPYDGKVEIHGFECKSLYKYAGGEVNKVARGGMFGGPVEDIAEVNSLYYSILSETLNNGFMGTEESLFTILLYTHPELIQYYEIEDNGLIVKFCEDLKNNKLQVKNEGGFDPTLNTDKTILYVLTFNSPKQFHTLIKSFLNDEDFLNKPRKILLNNSTDRSTDEEYERLCKEYDFEEIKKDNIGICGGRQFIAEHFEESGYDFMFFFEDDMFLNPQYIVSLDSNGFGRYTDKLYSKSLDIIKLNNYDFLKLSFTEFYGDNKKQWAWYNVPQDVREKYFPDNKSREFDKAPNTEFTTVKTYKGLSHIEGEVHYCNWPLAFSKSGNRKIFIDTKFKYPFEQTWMSFVYQLYKQNKLKTSVLLLSPINHDRFEHYGSSERKEN